MRKRTKRWIASYTKRGSRRETWKKLVRLMACIVVFCTTYALILPAITMEQQYICGMESHEHVAECYDEQEQLICVLQQHIHDEACKPDPTADLENAAHWEATMSGVEHTGNWEKDLLAIAKTQLGYTESRTNIHIRRNGELQPYTRYGAWFYAPYGDWDAKFAAFCLNYAYVPRNAIPWDSDSGDWLRQLQEIGVIAGVYGRIPKPGELVFFTRGDGETISMGIISAVDSQTDSETGEQRAMQLAIIAGDVDGRVAEVNLPASRIAGVCAMELALERYAEKYPGKQDHEKPTEDPSEAPTAEPTEVPGIEPRILSQTAETENYIVVVTYSSELMIPEGAALKATEYAKDSEIFRRRCAEAGYELDWLLNIGFFIGDMEVDLSGQFDVQVISKRGDELGNDITHFAEDGAERIDATPKTDGTEEGQTSVEFPAGSFSDFGGGIATVAETGPITLTVVDPSRLHDDVEYVIFACYNNQYLAMGNNGFATVNVGGGSPPSIGTEIELTKTSISDCTWRLNTIGNTGTFDLYSTATNQRMHIHFNALLLQNEQKPMVTRDFIGAGAKLAHPWDNNNNYVVYSSQNGWGGNMNSSNPATLYFAVKKNYPHAVHTGDVNISRLRFLNLRGEGENGVRALAGCTFLVTSDAVDAQGKPVYETTIVSGNNPIVQLPSDIPVGSYTITEVSAAQGYIRDDLPVRHFTVQELNGEKLFVTNESIGTFINHPKEEMVAKKTAEVENYENRIYQVMLEATSNLRKYEMDPVDIRLVVDQSNSMLFPSGMTALQGKTVTLGLNDGENDDRMNALNLDKSKMYYIISDPEGTSTVWCIWHDGSTWMYQDSSYYAKAKHGNAIGYQTPGEQAIFPIDDTYRNQPTTATDSQFDKARSNGGALDKNMTGSGLGTYIDSASNDQRSFQIYTANGEYNRLHYLEQALGYLVVELADANPQNRVSLTLFTKEVNHNECVPDTELTPDAVTRILDKVDSINTSGGTRQDIALKHVYDHADHEPESGYKSYTVLITDGAPVTSGEQKSLGNPYLDNNIDENSGEVYPRIRAEAKKIREKEGSTLMTVALAMENVAGGAHVLENIASDGYSFAYSDAAQLINALQELIYRSFTMREEIPMQADVVDEISDSFYPVAWVNAGSGQSTGRRVLVQDATKDWILLEENDWITVDGQFTTGSDRAGQLLRREDGTFYVQWKNQSLYSPDARDIQRVAWVDAGTGKNSGRTMVDSDGTRDWVLLQEGDWIDQNGKYLKNAPTGTSALRSGQLVNGTIAWGRWANANNRILYTAKDNWRGNIYIKAKEDFIGGNAIDTNKSAYITYADEQTREVFFPTPTVNVRLLDMNEMHSEVTVYLGDIVNEVDNSPLDSLKYFYNNTKVTKLIPGEGNVLNAVASADGLEEAVFYLRYAMGRDLTADEWETLVDGGIINVQYTYDNASSHGPVGSFTFRLEKEGSSSEYGVHQAVHACQPGGDPLTEECQNPAERYTLHVSYTAYKLNEDGRPAQNVHNGSDGPGTEVGTGRTLETGLGELDKENVHEVHVISGSIEITKRFASTVTATENTTFTFVLHNTADGTDTTRDVIRTITIPAGSQEGSASIVFDNLPRGTYTVTEIETEEYAVHKIRVQTSTNCYSEPAPGSEDRQVLFRMGSNRSDANVIAKAGTDRYTSYTDSPNGVFGEAEFTNKERVYEGEVPVEKVWDDGAENHRYHEVYVVLLENGVPVLNEDGSAKLLKLTSQNNWQGTFTVPLAHKNDTVAAHNFTVREVSGISDTELYGWQKAKVAGTDNIVYYEKVVEDSHVIGVGGIGYIVDYEQGTDGTWIVTNFRGYELPETGGMGTSHFTFGGSLMVASALMYICITGHKRRKGGR